MSASNGTAWTILATQSPDAGRTLAHPPFTFSIPGHFTNLRAEGLIGSVVRATHIVRQPLTAKRLVMSIEPDTIVANGSDLSRVLISIVDSNGTLCPYATATINVSLSGPGTLIGDNPITAANETATHQCGSFGILAQSRYAGPGSIIITAASSGLTSASDTLISLPVTAPVATVPRDLKPAMRAPEMQLSSISDRLPGIIVITCSVPKNSPMRLRVYNCNGRLVGNLFNGISQTENLTSSWRTKRLVPGVYLIRLDVGDKNSILKTLVVR